MSELTDLISKYRLRLLARERKAVYDIAHSYAAIWRDLSAELKAVLSRIEQARAAGKAVSPAWLFQDARTRELLRQVEDEIRKWAADVADHAAILQEFGARAGVDYAIEQLELTNGVLGVFSRLNTRAIETLLGAAADGTPLARLFDGIGPGVRDAWRRQLATGIALGRNPRIIARLVARETALGFSRASTIARTEMLRAYRVSAHETARENSQVVNGWVWVASLSERTCPACLAMHGTFHPMTEEFHDHPNGRCTAAFTTRSWADLGVAGMDEFETKRQIPDAQAWLKTLTDEQVNGIFGAGAAKIWKAGKLPLSEFATLKRNSVWGDTWQPTPLHKLMEMV